MGQKLVRVRSPEHQAEFRPGRGWIKKHVFDSVDRTALVSDHHRKSRPWKFLNFMWALHSNIYDRVRVYSELSSLFKTTSSFW